MPACLGAPLLMSLVSGDIKSFFEYDEEEQDEELSEDEVEKLINEDDKKDN